MAKKSLLFQFTQAQLNAYIKDENSCVKCVPSKMHIGFPPYGLDNFKESLLAIISTKKIGTYDADSRGIVLDVRNIKLEGTMSMIRYDSPELHLNIHAKFYVFQPHLGALLTGTVKHISKRHVSALIYNVFNVSIRLNGDFKRKLQVNKDISFRVKKFDLQNVLPYIEGELVGGGESDNGDSGIGGGDTKPLNNKKVFGGESSSSEEESEDEKVFKSLVVKTESQAKPSESSSSSDDSSDDDEESKSAFPLPKVKQEGVKKENGVSNKKKTPAGQSSSSEESSDDDDEPKKSAPVPVPIPTVVKKEKETKKSSPTKTKAPAAKPNRSSSESDSSDDDRHDSIKLPPSQFHTPKSIVKQEKKDSSSSDSSSDEEEAFKIPVPKVVVKREMTPSKKIKKEDSASSASETEQANKKKVASVKKKVLQSPMVEIPVEGTFLAEKPVEKAPAKAKKTPAKGKAAESTPVKVKEEKSTPLKKGKKNSLATEEIVKQEPVDKTVTPSPKKTTKAKKTDSDKETTSPSKKAKKTVEPVKVQTKAAPPPAADSSSDSSDDDDDVIYNGSLNLNHSIQNLVSEIYSSKLKEDTPAKKKPVAAKKRKLSIGEGSEDSPAGKKKKATPAKKKVQPEAFDLSKLFGNDILSSTRLDSASPVATPKKKKKVTIKE